MFGSCRVGVGVVVGVGVGVGLWGVMVDGLFCGLYGFLWIGGGVARGGERGEGRGGERIWGSVKSMMEEWENEKELEELEELEGRGEDY